MYILIHSCYIMYTYTCTQAWTCMSMVLCSLGHFISVMLVTFVIPNIKVIIMNVFCCLYRSPAVLSVVDPCLFCPGLHFCPSTSWNSEQRRTHAAGDHLTHRVDLSASYRDLHYDDSPGQVYTCYGIVKDVRLLISRFSSTQKKGMLFLWNLLSWIVLRVILHSLWCTVAELMFCCCFHFVHLISFSFDSDVFQ